MPHSSGGGSHGGGSHGGSHHSSSRGGSGNYGRVGSKPFTGAKRYYYYKNHRPVYVYANYDITEQPKKSRFWNLLFFAPFLLIGLVAIISAFGAPSRLDVDYSDTNIYIVDNAQVIESQSQLRNMCQEFFEKTGITPAIVTMYNDDWEDYYYDLEDYAYDFYVDSFEDEKHWLIMYSKDRLTGEWNDWYWEGMQGDDTDAILNQSVLDVFNEKLQKYLLQESKYTAGEAITTAFSDILPILMEPYTDWELIGSIGIFELYIIIMMYFAVIRNPNKKYANAKKYDKAEEPIEFTCDYCGGIYIAGTCMTCPYCGAAVKPLEGNG